MLRATTLTPLLAALLLYGCSDEPPQGKKQRPASDHLVTTATVVQLRIGHRTTLTGSLQARRQVEIHNQEEGRIERLPRYEGDHVVSGEVLVEMERTLLTAELDKARATRKQAELDLKRIKRVVSQKLAAEEQLARSKTALEVASAEQRLLETRLRHTTIRAPFDAIVSQRLVSPGDIAPRHTHLLTLIDPASLITRIAVSELLLPSLKVGDPVEVRIDALGEQHYSGNVLRIHPTLNEQSRRGTVEIELKPVPEGARAGQLVRVTLDSDLAERRLIPSEAVLSDRDGSYVYRVNNTQQVHRTAIRTGLHLDNRIEVVEGLERGDRVVIRGFLGLREGKSVVESGTTGRKPTAKP